LFGPAALLVRCADMNELLAILEALEGQLTAALHIDDADHPAARRLMPVLERKVGRILINAFGTDVEVAHAMVHGGPYSATSEGRTTSVGSLAIERFLRPICYQDVPEALLPQALRPANPLGAPRRIDSQRES
jgi:NADP-dependent aldehyde dehydrogenase